MVLINLIKLPNGKYFGLAWFGFFIISVVHFCCNKYGWILSEKDLGETAV